MCGCVCVHACVTLYLSVCVVCVSQSEKQQAICIVFDLTCMCVTPIFHHSDPVCIYVRFYVS